MDIEAARCAQLNISPLSKSRKSRNLRRFGQKLYSRAQSLVNCTVPATMLGTEENDFEDTSAESGNEESSEDEESSGYEDDSEDGDGSDRTDDKRETLRTCLRLLRTMKTKTNVKSMEVMCKIPPKPNSLDSWEAIVLARCRTLIEALFMFRSKVFIVYAWSVALSHQ